MAPERLPTRNSASLATTASALIALVAIASLMTSVPSGSAARITPIESRVPLREAGAVRAVAAAVVAAARELTATQPTPIVASHAEHNSQPARFVGVAGCGSDVLQVNRSRFIGERLLDLPPPVC